jgi:hypothetical protein
MAQNFLCPFISNFVQDVEEDRSDFCSPYRVPERGPS